MSKWTYYSNGKLLLSAEYGVLDGALALAVPTSFGQYLTIENNIGQDLMWTSLGEDGKAWFKATFKTPDLEIIDATDSGIAITLQSLLREALKLHPGFGATLKNKSVTTKLTFPRNWGLGSSSTLINNLAQWAQVNPYELLSNTMGGSGYDIACASNNSPIYYQLAHHNPIVEKVQFNPPFQDHLFFVYLNQKQDSRAAILNYRNQDFDKETLIKELTHLTQQLSKTSDLTEFETLMVKHECLLSEVLQMESVKTKFFKDYFGEVKSLGGWGGDFIMATGNEKTPDYFKVRGFTTVIPYNDMVLREN